MLLLFSRATADASAARMRASSLATARRTHAPGSSRNRAASSPVHATSFCVTSNPRASATICSCGGSDATSLARSVEESVFISSSLRLVSRILRRVGPSESNAGAPAARGADVTDFLVCADAGRREVAGFAVRAAEVEAEARAAPPASPLAEKGMPCLEVLQKGGRSKDRLRPTSASRPRNPDSNRFLRSAARNSAALLGTPPALAPPALPFEPLPEPAFAPPPPPPPPRDASIATGGQRIDNRRTRRARQKRVVVVARAMRPSDDVPNEARSARGDARASVSSLRVLSRDRRASPTSDGACDAADSARGASRVPRRFRPENDRFEKKKGRRTGGSPREENQR